MTIGPEPMISTDARSPRRGTTVVYHADNLQRAATGYYGDI